MTGIWNDARARWAAAAVALFAFLWRVYPFWRHGAFGVATDYDEGVYFSAASLLLQGELPYRDFTFVHPPGLIAFLSLTSAWATHPFGPEVGFTLARWVAALVAAVNVLLVFRLTERWTGAAGGLVAAALYATYPELVIVERGPFLEPVLNLACLSMAAALQKAESLESAGHQRWLLVAGVLGGLAVTVKVWAVFWVLGGAFAVLVRSPRGVVRFLLGVGLGAAVVVLPFVLAAPARFFTETLLFHLWRPPDGTPERLPRLGQIIAKRHLASPLLALACLGFFALRRGPKVNVLFATAYVLLLAAFLASAAYWNQYNAHLIAAEAVLAGGFAGWILMHPRLRLLLALPAVASLSFSVRASARLHGAPPSKKLTEAVRRHVPQDACLFAFEPAWGLAAGRLPSRAPEGPLVVDSYARMLLSAVEGGERFSHAQAAFESLQSQREVKALLHACRFAAVGDRGRWQLSPESRRWLETSFQEVEPGSDVWRRLTP
ncbi:MAG: glycosyltransferase family 39 protein [Myxococcota bacterium]